MKPGDLVQYVPYDIAMEPLVRRGIVLKLEDEKNKGSYNIRVRWLDHESWQRDWYAQQELSVISKCADLK